MPEHSKVIEKLHERISHMHPIAAIADRIDTASLIASIRRRGLPPEEDEAARDVAEERAKHEVELATAGCDELLDHLVDLVPYPCDDHAKAMELIERIVVSAMGWVDEPTMVEVSAVTERLYELAYAAERLRGRGGKKTGRSARRSKGRRTRAAYTRNARRVAEQLSVVAKYRGLTASELAALAKVPAGSLDAALKQLGDLVANTRREGYAPADDRARAELGRIGSA